MVNFAQIINKPLDSTSKTYIEDRDLWQVLQGLPLPADVVDGADDDDVLELVVVKVGGP